jgi:hypothetical protein
MPCNVRAGAGRGIKTIRHHSDAPHFARPRQVLVKDEKITRVEE